VILEDDSNPGSSKALKLTNGTLGVEDVCWNTSTSLTPTFG
jgi:hypothetical protein